MLGRVLVLQLIHSVHAHHVRVHGRMATSEDAKGIQNHVDCPVSNPVPPRLKVGHRPNGRVAAG